ncbi:hypothetical protein HMI55_000021, partial [Coelomomyces lativittatus]
MRILIKRSPQLDPSRSIPSQVTLVQLPGPALNPTHSSNSLSVSPSTSEPSLTLNSPNPSLTGLDVQNPTSFFETIYLFIHHAVAPYFNAYVSNHLQPIVSKEPTFSDNSPLQPSTSSIGNRRDSMKGIPAARKKFAELELTLLYLQQNVDIPDIQLQVHPVILDTIQKCREKDIKLTLEALPSNLLSDSSFLNKLQSEVNLWIKDIQKVTKLSKDLTFGSVSQQINFWLSMERALEKIDKQLKSVSIQFVLDILKQAKRFHATVSFYSDTGIQENIDMVRKYNILMKEFPIEPFLSATDLSKLNEALEGIFVHIAKKAKLSMYPVQRLLHLVEGLSKDLNDQILNLLLGPKLMSLPFPEFDSLTSLCFNLFHTWDFYFKEFSNLARDLTRKRNNKYLPIKIQVQHLKLQERIHYIRQFRHQHEHLESTIARVMPTSKLNSSVGSSSSWHQEHTNALDAVDSAYAPLRTLDVLDVSVEGAEIWTRYEKAYNDRVGFLENMIVVHLRDTLATSKNANEMFRVFSKFNALFVRQKIRAAIQEYQDQLIETVKKDIKSLQDKFRLGYPASEAYRISIVRDIPPISGAITWARQIDRQLETYMQHVGDVLGQGWESHPEGSKLSQDFSSFKKKLDTTLVFEQWVQDIMQKDLRYCSKSNAFKYGEATIGEAKRIWPFAVSLKESLRAYQSTLDKLDAPNSDARILIAVFLRDVQMMISSGIQLQWESLSVLNPNQDSVHYQFVRSLEAKVSIFQDKLDVLMGTLSDIKMLINQLEISPYNQAKLKAVLSSIQKHVDELNLGGFSNLDLFAARLDIELEKVLKLHLENAIHKWLHTFTMPPNDTRMRRGSMRKTMLLSESMFHSDSIANPNSIITMFETEQDDPLPLQIQVHEICLQNQSLFLPVPLEATKSKWISQFQQWIAIICNQKRIQTSHYTISTAQLPIPSTFRSLLELLPIPLLSSVYTQMDGILQQASNYIQIWFQYQALWKLEPYVVYEKLGDDLKKWQLVLEEVKRGRTTFDVTETIKSFGPLIIDFEQVQSKVNAKYDQWQREIMVKYSSKLGNTMRERYLSLTQARSQLETYQFETSTTSDSIAFIILLQEIKRKVSIWSQDITFFKSGQRFLERQRFSFPSDWLYLEQIEGEWSAFNDILSRKDQTIQTQLAGLQAKITIQHKTVEQAILDLLQDWDQNKPSNGDLLPEVALQSLKYYESKIFQLRNDGEQLMLAKEAVNLLIPTSSEYSNRLDVATEELRDLKELWSALSQINEELQDLKDLPWLTFNARKVRSQLVQLQDHAKAMPTKLRQYVAYEYILNQIQSFLNLHVLVAELRGEAMKERHWKNLLKELHVSVIFNELTLGHIWSMNLQKNEKSIRELLTHAQGELALENFLAQVKEIWTNYSLDLIQYQNKCRLIKGWEDLFKICSDHLSSLQTMKMSPYYRTFEEEASNWEQKLSKIQILFDVWIDVQRQWIYLEGAFTSSSDIKHLLPVEVVRFQNINTEFMTIMKKVYKSPFVLDVLTIVNIQKSMERLADLLKKIQKALGEYLEKERSAFPRLYFVGDEDLLEMIGNAKDIDRVQKHLKKLFAGIHSLGINTEQSHVLALHSREGEVIQLKTPVEIRERRLNEWLLSLEKEMRDSLLYILGESIRDFTDLIPLLKQVHTSTSSPLSSLLQWMDRYPSQIVILTVQIGWTTSVDTSLESKQIPTDPLHTVECILDLLAEATSSAQSSPVLHKKCENLITELVHQKDVLRHLVAINITSSQDFKWLYYMRYYYQMNSSSSYQVYVRIANAQFEYGFEYLGVTEKLVQTNLTDRCYLSLTQALNSRLGGSPFGPAGTGKTESVKALGASLGKLVLVFCCDETFDFQSMGRIFIGLCMAGAWGCFDEFNRLEERILSAVSQQIQSIQSGLHELTSKETVVLELLGKQFPLHPDTGIFITMNPGYAGRRHLPDNLKKLFRSVAMTSPDSESIAQVMLFSQGFRTAEILAVKIASFFNLCSEQLSHQSHYDFGLRALKSVLVSAGRLKRIHLNSSSTDRGLSVKEEQYLLIQSVSETVLPKLVEDDILLTQNLLKGIFSDFSCQDPTMLSLENNIRQICEDQCLVLSNSWMKKILQLYQIQKIHHGIMLVGRSSTGKTVQWKTLLAALERTENIESVSYLLDPKAITKDQLFGTLDLTTREWMDGLFTRLLRRIIENIRGEANKRHWIIFDGDVDPEWIETLNSLLDDNKLLTLPNGERLSLPDNVRIVFEVDSLKYATPATVSRCGMIWYSENIVTPAMMCSKYLQGLSKIVMELVDDTTNLSKLDSLRIQSAAASILSPYMQENNLIQKAILFSQTELVHIMDFIVSSSLTSLFSLLDKAVKLLLEFEARNPDVELSLHLIESFLTKKLLLALVWSMAGATKPQMRQIFTQFLSTITAIPFPPDSKDLIDFDVQLPMAEWVPWAERVPSIEMATHNVPLANIVIPTLDTVRLENILNCWLSEHRPLLLCGPPGSGKTMTLINVLRGMSDAEIVNLNFSSASTPDLVLKALDQHCEYKKTTTGYVLSPRNLGKWLVLFCDEINLPAKDPYESQPVISLLRQMVDWNGFWRPNDYQWVRLERIKFAGACNPPTDPGRNPLSHRFLRHVSLLMVDYPERLSLIQIYSTFCRALLKLVPSIRGYSEALTNAMVSFYLDSQSRFTPSLQPHYVYSPRELTRWVRGIYEAIKELDELSVEGLVRIWAHEALRLFQDRLVAQEDIDWTNSHLDEVALTYFPNISSKALQRPILFSNWLSKMYLPVEQDALQEFVRARLRVFYEEELEVPLILFDHVLEHVLRIDRVFRQVQGHLLLIGISGSGKTTLSRFVAWMNGYSIFQLQTHNKYTSLDFDEDLRRLLKRCGCKGEKVCFILDETNMINSTFLERMNTLLTNSEVPGLFEGDEYSSLLSQCKEVAAKDGLLVDTHEDLYTWFIKQIMKNLHVVFSMNIPRIDGLSKLVSTSPALFNRCVIDWFGDWNNEAFYQVAKGYTLPLDLDLNPSFIAPDTLPLVCHHLEPPLSYRDTILNGFVQIHQSVNSILDSLKKEQDQKYSCTPRHFLDFVSHFVKIFKEKKEELEDEQKHLNVGLERIQETVEHVEELRSALDAAGNVIIKKTEASNEKLTKMLENQKEAEKKKASLQEISRALDLQTLEIQQRKQSVETELSLAEPAVEEAKQGVSGIKKQHLTEVRSMGSPPDAVKLAMESVCSLLGHQIDSWKSVQTVIRRDDFISSIVNYDTERMMTNQLREKMKRDYLKNTNYKYELINHASKACGPLVQWVIAQVTYSEILNKVGPLREEVKSLEQVATMTKSKMKSMDEMVVELEKSIALYKDEYAVLISEIQNLKAEMDKIKTKVDRSVALLSSLSSEKERWDATSKTFGSQMNTLVGDVMLSSAYLAYCGPFDQQCRLGLWSSWSSHLRLSHIQYRNELSVIDYLCNCEQRLQWYSNGLPKDDLCLENALMMNRYNRYPLVIDPSGQATQFILNQNKDKRVVVTSFLDDSFLKHLESALRFGTPILIQDVESVDPMLNPILNKELHRTVTRDSHVKFAADISSRVNIISFTVTKASLQAHCLNRLLFNERADVEQKRNDLLLLQSEFTTRLRALEKDLLQTLNESKGNILEDDQILETLELLKAEAAEVQEKVIGTEKIMEEIGRVTNYYTPLARSCANIYFLMEHFSQVFHIYQFSLEFFYEIFSSALKKPAEAKLIDHQQRLNHLTIAMFNETFRRVSRGLRHSDHLPFAMNLAYIYLDLESPESSSGALFVYLMGSNALSPLQDTQLSSAQVQGRIELVNKLFPKKKNFFEHVSANPDGWVQFLDGRTILIPELGDSNPEPLQKCLFHTILSKVFRTDLFQSSLQALISEIFHHQLLLSHDHNFYQIICDEVNGTTPLAFCSTRGMDASSLLEHLCQEMGVSIFSVAMGTSEGLALADKEITKRIVNGGWILLKNVHLAPEWLSQLEKRLHLLRNTHSNFRLLLTMEVTSTLPVSLLRHFRIFLFEPRPGVRANLLECLRMVQSLPSLFQQGPNEKARLYFLICWLHSVLIERQRYIPLGWSKTIAFNDADLESALRMVDAWASKIAQSRTNVPPERIPFSAISILLKEAIYGGKIDSEMDQSILDSFVDQIFQVQSFETNFPLAKDLPVPLGTKFEHFLEWVQNLPEEDRSGWLGLPTHAEKFMLAQSGYKMQQTLHHIWHSLFNNKDLNPLEPANTVQKSIMSISLTTQHASSVENVLNLVHEWFEKTKIIRRLELPENFNSTLIRHCLLNEHMETFKIYTKSNQDILNLQKHLLLGSYSLPPNLRSIYLALELYKVPDSWMSSDEPIQFWIQSLCEKINMLTDWLQGDLNSLIWIGSLYHPETLITNARQEYAQTRNVSLEKLRVELDLEGRENGIRLSKLYLESCEWDPSTHELILSEGPGMSIPTVTLTFSDAPIPSSNQIRLPFYTNNKRQHLLCYVWLSSRQSPSLFSQYGVHFKVGKKIGEGSFGVIYEGINLLTNSSVAIKFESKKSEAPQLREEFKTYKILAGC